MKKTIEKPIQSVERALGILEQFTLENKELGLSELANRTGLKRTTCFGLAETLLANGYLSFNEETSKYHLGIKLFQLGQVYAQGINLRDLARPYLLNLSEKYGQIVHLVIADKLDAIYIEKVGEQASFRIRSQVGTRALRYGAAVSKIVLANCYEQMGDGIFSEPFQQYTYHTIMNREEFLAELDRVRRQGYAEDNEELDIGLKCVAAPLYDYNHTLLGAISISGRTEAFQQNLPSIIADTKATAAQISKQVGAYR
jgi:IclR family KDG regulon transcriptional repressor